MADQGGGKENGERRPVITLVAVDVGLAGWWMRWVKMNWPATWSHGRRGCKGLGTGLDGERLRRRGFGWKMVEEGGLGGGNMVKVCSASLVERVGKVYVEEVWWEERGIWGFGLICCACACGRECTRGEW